jgi:hypothetical protein
VRVTEYVSIAQPTLPDKSRDYVAPRSTETFHIVLGGCFWSRILPRQDVCCHICQYCSTSFVRMNGDLLFDLPRPSCFCVRTVLCRQMCSICKNRVISGRSPINAHTRTPFQILKTLLHRPVSCPTFWLAIQGSFSHTKTVSAMQRHAPRIDLIKGVCLLVSIRSLRQMAANSSSVILTTVL